MKPVIGLLRRMGARNVIYMDDLWGGDGKLETGTLYAQLTVMLMQFLGFLVNGDKSILGLETLVEDYLGFIIDSREITLALAQMRIIKIQAACRDLLSKGRVSVSKVAKVLGQLVATARAVFPAPLHFRQLQIFTAEESKKVWSNDGAQQRMPPRTSMEDRELKQLEWKIVYHDRPGRRAKNTNRCQRPEMGSSLRTGYNAGPVDHGRKEATYQRERADGCLFCHQSLHERSASDPSTLEDRQYNNGESNHENGVNKVPEPVPEDCRSVELLHPEKHNSQSGASARSAQCDCRLRIKVFQDSSNWKLDEKNISSNKPDLGHSRSGPVCRQDECATSQIHQLEARPNSHGNPCIYSEMEQHDRVCVSPILPDKQVSSKDKERTSTDHPNRTPMARPTMVWDTASDGNRGPNPSTSHGKHLESPRGGSHPLMEMGSLSLAAWRVSGTLQEIQPYQQQLKHSCKESWLLDPRGLTEAPGRGGAAGVVNGSWIQFQPLWKM